MKGKSVSSGLKRKVSSRRSKTAKELLRADGPAEHLTSSISPAHADGSFQLLFAKNPLPMYIVDRETMQFLEVNEAAVKQYGYSREELLRMRSTEIRPSEEIERYKAAM